MVFRGNFPAKLDAQGRVKIPSAHRKVFEEEYGRDVYVTSITGENVLVFPLAEWEELENKLKAGSKFGKAQRRFMRNTSYWGQMASMDKQGRLSIQLHLREEAGIDGELAVMGSLNSLEIWNAEKIRRRMAAEPVDEDELAELADLGI